MSSSRRIILIGIDGASYEMMSHLASGGTLPHMQRLIEAGTFRRMTSSIPEVSPVAWNSIITGADPAEHGVFGFTDLAPGTYRTTFANSYTADIPPFWAREGNGRAVVINMPFSYPARPLNGVLISGFVALDLAKATYPPSLVPELKRMHYSLDVDSSKAHQSPDLFLRDLDRTLEGRIAAYRHLWDSELWQTFVLVFTGTDRLSHFLWDAYLDPAHRCHEAFLDHFRQVDAVVGEIADRLRPEDLLVIVSDHGFENLEQNVFVNAILREAGLLSFETPSPQGVRHLSHHAQAFALEPSRIYVHTRDRFPKGSVSESGKATVLDEVTALFEDLRFEGRPVIKKVYHKEEIYSGPHLDRAPDLVLLAEPGFNLRGSLQAPQCFGKDIFKGKHARDNAILLMYGDFDEDMIPVQPQVADVVGTVDRIISRDSLPMPELIGPYTKNMPEARQWT